VSEAKKRLITIYAVITLPIWILPLGLCLVGYGAYRLMYYVIWDELL